MSLNLNDGSYRSYRKSNEKTNYIQVNSDHPPSIIKEIPRSVEKKTVKTNIGRIFIKLISKHFPPNHKFVKVFNKNTIKRSILACQTSDQK